MRVLKYSLTVHLSGFAEVLSTKVKAQSFFARQKEPKNISLAFSDYFLKLFIKYVINNGLVQFWKQSKSIYI